MHRNRIEYIINTQRIVLYRRVISVSVHNQLVDVANIPKSARRGMNYGWGAFLNVMKELR
jgi:hypothetical protein